MLRTVSGTIARKTITSLDEPRRVFFCLKKKGKKSPEDPAARSAFISVVCSEPRVPSEMHEMRDVTGFPSSCLKQGIHTSCFFTASVGFKQDKSETTHSEFPFG